MTSPVRVIPTVSSSCRFITTLTPPSKVSVSKVDERRLLLLMLLLLRGLLDLLAADLRDVVHGDGGVRGLEADPGVDMLLSEPEGDCSAENMLVVSNPKTDFALLFLLLTSTSPSSSPCPVLQGRARICAGVSVEER